MREWLVTTTGAVSMKEGITMEERLAIVLASLLGVFSVLLIVNVKIVPLDQVLRMLR